MEELGAGLVAISPQTREFNDEVKRKHRITYPVLSDHGNGFARSLRVVYRLPDDLRKLYKRFGIDLGASNGIPDGRDWELPLATRLVVDRDGTVVSVDADPDYTVRPEPEATLDVLKTLLSD
jgi:peroxiredoxin